MSERMDQIIQELTKDSIYSRLGDALREADGYMGGNPDMRFVFQTKSLKGDVEYLAQTDSASLLLKAMDEGCDGFSLSMAFEAVSCLEHIAVEAGRPVIKHQKHGDYFMTIAPVQKL